MSVTFELGKVSVPVIFRKYEMKRETLIRMQEADDLDTAVMNHLTFTCLHTHAMKLKQEHRDALLCFEHFTYKSIFGDGEVTDERGNVLKKPDHLLVLQVKFLEENSYINLGSIGYMHNTVRSFVSDLLHDFIEDCCRAGARVIASCSSAKFELLIILGEMNINFGENNLVSYVVSGRGSIVHIFDPAWMMRKLKVLFYNHDIIFDDDEDGRSVASYERVAGLLVLPEAEAQLHPEVFQVTSRTTSSALKTFSASLAQLLEEYGDIKKPKPSPDVIAECRSTAKFIHMMDQLFDAFNASDDVFLERKPLCYPLSSISRHWALWERCIPILTSMRFVSRIVTNKKASKSAGVQNGGVRYFNDDEYSVYEGPDKDLSNVWSYYMPADYTPKNAYPKKSEKPKQPPADATDDIEALQLQLEEVQEVMIKIKSHSAHPELIGRIQKLLSTIHSYNLEVRISRRDDASYRYLSVRTSKYIHLVGTKFQDTEAFYLLYIDSLMKLKNMFRFLNMQWNQCWLASIAGFKYIFTKLFKGSVKSLQTRIVNCDGIHSYVEIIRAVNNLPFWKISLKSIFGEYFDYDVCVLAFAADFNVTIDVPLVPVNFQYMNNSDGQKTDGSGKKMKKKRSKKQQPRN